MPAVSIGSKKRAQGRDISVTGALAARRRATRRPATQGQVARLFVLFGKVERLLKQRVRRRTRPQKNPQRST